MLGALINSITGRTKRKEQQQQQAEKRRALSKHSVYGSSDYELHEEAYDKEDYQRTMGLLDVKHNLYGQ